MEPKETDPNVSCVRALDDDDDISGLLPSWNGSFCSVALPAAVARGVACLESAELSPPHRTSPPQFAVGRSAPLHCTSTPPLPSISSLRFLLHQTTLPASASLRAPDAIAESPPHRRRSSDRIARSQHSRPARPPAAGAAGTAWQQQPPRPRRHGPSRTTSSSRAPSR